MESDAFQSSIGDITIDLKNKEIMFPVTVVTSLGVTQETYDWMKVLGGVIGVAGTLFGAGFALTLFGKAKARNDRK